MSEQEGGLPDSTPDSGTEKKTRTRRPGQRLSARQQREGKRKFLEAFALLGIVTGAAKSIGVSRSRVYEWREKDPAFAAQWEEAEKEANDRIRQEIYRRGVNGVQRPVYQKGEQVGSITEYSDTLLIFLAKSRMPEFRDKVELSGHVQHGHVDMSGFTAEERARIFELAAREASKGVTE